MADIMIRRADGACCSKTIRGRSGTEGEIERYIDDELVL